VRDAQHKSLRDISEAVKDLATRARSKKLKPDEYQGGTITVSNLGSYGIEFFDAIINPPQAVIVSVGAIVKKPVVGPNDTIVVGQRLAIGVSADHRVVDGAVAAQYLSELRRLLRVPRCCWCEAEAAKAPKGSWPCLDFRELRQLHGPASFSATGAKQFRRGISEGR
jgi:pyruvate/2-oxoglutarate dehydrogenase complex dihydrolipoamide acyltransferase (E2) component